MSLNLVYGKQLESNYLDAGDAIVKEMNQGSCFRVSKMINESLFGGGPLAPKEFLQILTIDIPKAPYYHHQIIEDKTFITIEKVISTDAVIGYLEGIPVIGSAIAAINAVGHLFGLLFSYLTLKNAVKAHAKTERNDFNVGRGACLKTTNRVFTAAVAYTNHQNQLVGSLLSLIPFVKPIVRIAQGTIYNCTAGAV